MPVGLFSIPCYDVLYKNLTGHVSKFDPCCGINLVILHIKSDVLNSLILLLLMNSKWLELLSFYLVNLTF